MQLSRRKLLGTTLAAGAGSGLLAQSVAAEVRPANEPFIFCLNTSTLRGHEIPLVEKIQIAADAGYKGLELWIDELDKYVQTGASLEALGRRIKELGLTVESGIGFSEWIVDDDQRRAKGMDDAKRSMELLAAVGGKRIAAPPAGAVDGETLDLLKVAERYHALLELGEKTGIVPQVELWGFSKNLSRLGEVVMVAVESGHPQACVLADVYHMYKGGSEVAGLRLLAGSSMHVLHVNDYPAQPPRSQITDAQRVYPGDGVAPLGAIFRILRDIGFRGALSLELFNRDYWRQDPALVARTGLEKMRAAVSKSLAS